MAGRSEADSADASRNRNGKSPGAFRTISEAADELGLPQHVLRFWESKFPQVKPMKRGGGRRYYRPEDIALLERIRDLLHVEGYTIKGVQKLLRDPSQRDTGANGHAHENDSGGEDGLQAAEATNRDMEEAIDSAIGRLTELRQALLKAFSN
ncbi:MAG: MerR family transcriptional regulator [Rhodospirillales bacterium]